MRLALCGWLLLAVLWCSCGGGSRPDQAAGGAPVTRLEELSGVHPRLLLTAAGADSLREQLSGSHAWLWERFLQDLPHTVDLSTRRVEVDDTRLDGDLAPQLAFAWLMTGEDSLLAIARHHLLRLTDPENLGAPRMTWLT